MMSVLTTILSIVSALAINEVSELSPWAARKVVRWSACLRYPDPARAEARAEELAALIDARPGKLFKLITALYFAVAAIRAWLQRTIADASVPGRRLTGIGSLAVGIAATVILPLLVGGSGAGAAGAYASFSGVLAGFSFAGLSLYLAESEPGGTEKKGLDEVEPPIHCRDVAATIFYAMASLAMTSFLYASMEGEAATPVGTSPPAWVMAALLPDGVVLGLSVLVLFYGLTLVMLEQSLKSAAKWAYWAVEIAGLAVVLRFLLETAADEETAVSGSASGILSPWGSFWTVLGAVLLAVLLSLTGLNWVSGLRDRLRDHPTAPALVVFAIATVITAFVPLYDSGQRHLQSGVVIAAGTTLAIVAVVVFSLACGCVIRPRVGVPLRSDSASG
jgi:hypothetical protein